MELATNEHMTATEREIEHCIVMAQGYLTTLSLAVGRAAYGAEMERDIRDHIATGTVLRERLLDRVQTRLNNEAAERAA